METLRKLGRVFGMLLAGLLLLLGAGPLAQALAPESGFGEAAREGLLDVSLRLTALDEHGVPADLPERVDAAFDSSLVQYSLAPLGAALLIWLLLAGRAGKLPPPPGSEPEAAAPPEVVTSFEKKLQKKARKQAAALARAGRALEAAELCFQNGLMEDAAGHYIQAGELIRAAEIRHDQNRFIEAAELYLKAGSFDSAGVIFAQKEEWARAADAYVEAGNRSVAAEMFEKAGNWRRAAQCYEASDFPRHAAKAWVRCSEWARAAACLEPVIVESMTGAGHSDPKRQAESRKLILMAADLHTRANQEDKAQAILERGGCHAQAAEIALRRGRHEEAADLFLKAGDAQRASKVLEKLGRSADAMRVLAEHHRDRGDDHEAAKCFEAAQEWVAAGDLYRMLERFEEAGACYEKQGEFSQAAEMFRTIDQRERAAENHERAGEFAAAAECFALLGNRAKEAEMLVRAGEHLPAGEILHADGNDDEAIKVLQQVVPEHTGFAKASAILGEIFRQRGMLSLAQKKLTHAVGKADLDRDNVQAFYGLASVHEASGNAADALELYEKILAFDYHYGDVAERVAHCKKLVQQQGDKGTESSPLSGSQAQGRYHITGKLGRGGMGVVYKAQDSVLDRTVAFKVLPDTLKENPQALKNFLREAKSAARLNHPNIVQVYDAGEQDGVYYIAMEYVDGNTLKEIVKARGRISAGGIAHVLGQMCEALAYAHDQKIVHRDIKTANTMWTRDRRAKIMDFGLAKVVEEVRNHTTVVSGTPYYMSPEQTLGKNVDHRSDIYSLGVTIFELATGTLPFREGNLPYHHVHTPPPDPREFSADLPQAIAAIIERCLRKDPAERYQSAREILEELKGGVKG